MTPEEGLAVRYTQTLDAFYITTLYAPNATLVLTSPVPYVSGDEVMVVGGNLSGTVVPSELLANGSLQLSVSDEVRDADEYAWVFKISYDPADNTSDAGAGGGSASGSSSGNASRHVQAMWNLAFALLLASLVLF